MSEVLFDFSSPEVCLSKRLSFPLCGPSLNTSFSDLRFSRQHLKEQGDLQMSEKQLYYGVLILKNTTFNNTLAKESFLGPQICVCVF